MSSRVRLARNLAGFPFVNKASRTQRLTILESCRAQMQVAPIGERIAWSDLHRTAALDRKLLFERHLISLQHEKGKQSNGAGGLEEPRAVAVSIPDERVSIMVNEEDHLRVQVIRSGLDLKQALADADAIDDKLESGLDFSFSPRFGYLTACPTNVGTGLRLSVMLHLPGLRLMGNIEKAKRAAADMSLAVRGFYGEGTEAAGDFYQISNQTTLGKPESVLLREIEQEILPEIIRFERISRKGLMAKRRHDLEDNVFRALGILTNARLLTTEEAMQHLSMVRLGVVMGLITHISQVTVNQLMLLTQPGHLQLVIGHELDQEARRIARARIVRERLGPH